MKKSKSPKTTSQAVAHPRFDERALFDTKWFDYRHMTPHGCNLAFLLAYGTAFADFCETMGRRRYVNCFLQRHGKTESRYDPADPKAWSGWKHIVELRCWADKNCMRYDDFWKFAFAAAIELGFQKFYLPFFKAKDILVEVLGKWDSLQDEIIVYSNSEMFTPKAYVGSEIQDDYYWHLVNSAKNIYGDRWQAKTKTMMRDGKIPSPFFERYIK